MVAFVFVVAGLVAEVGDPRAYEGLEAAAASGPAGAAVGASASDESPGSGQGPSDELSLADIFGDDATDEGGTKAASDAASTGAATKDSTGSTASVSSETSNAGTSDKPTLGQKFRDKLELRYRLVTSLYYDVARVDKRGIGRNENRMELWASYKPSRHVQIVGDIEPVFFGVAQPRLLNDVATTQMLMPFHVESDAAYVALNDLWNAVDLKIGRQIVVWGTADRFNPTNNINPDDLEDRVLFTEPIANQMVVLDVAPWGDKLWFQGVYVPLFFPALLPPSAALALRDPEAPVPYVSENDQAAVGLLRDRMRARGELTPDVAGHVLMPDRSLANGQAAFKVGARLWDIDVSASYYYGRHDIPTPVEVQSSQVKSIDPVDYDDPKAALVPGCCFRSDAYLEYPKMQVFGLDFTTQVPFLRNMGFWGEAALFLPEHKRLHIEFPVDIDITPDDGVLNPVRDLTGTTVRRRPFVKATTGFDYTFGKHVYVQGQYLRGFIDDFGAGHIGNYVVGGTDLIFLGRHLIFRIFGVVDLQKNKRDPGSYVVFPEIIYTPPFGGVTFELGGFVLLSDVATGRRVDPTGVDATKFGQRAAGSSIVFFKTVAMF